MAAFNAAAEAERLRAEAEDAFLLANTEGLTSVGLVMSSRLVTPATPDLAVNAAAAAPRVQVRRGVVWEELEGLGGLAFERQRRVSQRAGSVAKGAPPGGILASNRAGSLAGARAGRRQNRFNLAVVQLLREATVPLRLQGNVPRQRWRHATAAIIRAARRVRVVGGSDKTDAVAVLAALRIATVARKGAITTVHTPDEAESLHYHQQGDEGYYSEDMVHRRLELLDDPAVRKACRMWWNVVHKSAGVQANPLQARQAVACLRCGREQWPLCQAVVALRFGCGWRRFLAWPRKWTRWSTWL